MYWVRIAHPPFPSWDHTQFPARLPRVSWDSHSPLWHGASSRAGGGGNAEQSQLLRPIPSSTPRPTKAGRPREARLVQKAQWATMCHVLLSSCWLRWHPHQASEFSTCKEALGVGCANAPFSVQLPEGPLALLSVRATSWPPLRPTDRWRVFCLLYESHTSWHCLRHPSTGPHCLLCIQLCHFETMTGGVT